MKRLLLLAPLLLASSPVWGSGYASLLDQGYFYLSRGSTYGPEAVRSLEQARALDPERAGGDGRLLGGLARAYAATSRYTEAFWALQGLEALGPLGDEEQGLRERLLGESGLGRIRLGSAVPQHGLRVRLEPAPDARFDVSARRVLERLGELLGRGLGAGPEGVALLAPEGRYRFTVETPILHWPREPLDLEVWAGDEVAVALVPVFPEPSRWRVEPRSRSVALAWPALEGAAYRLLRRLGEEEVLVYEGPEPGHEDQGLPVGADVAYRLEVLGPGGELLAASSAAARTLPPVSQLGAEGSLGDDLRSEVRWTLGAGAADRVRVVREDTVGDRVVLDLRAPEPLGRGRAVDGPFLPEPEARKLRYRVEAWVDGEEVPSATARAEAAVPALVERVSEVAESIDRGSVVVGWSTVPRDGAAEGYAVFRQRGPGVEGELVGRIAEPFAREFDYEVSDPLAATAWRHFVVPYVGDRYLLDPERLRVSGAVPAEGLERRQRRGEALPNVGLSWDAYPGAQMYAVTFGEREVLVKRPYVEASGLQNPLMGTDNRVEVFALDARGARVPLLVLELAYRHYPRSQGQGAEP
ncbi:MAG: hypothetical protein AB1578_14165 [Thermodesulfobacteriota bacterium]